jgi:ubiquinol-cytochrome c reductase cytochrome b subunit
MLDRFLIWLDDRTSIPTLMHKIRHWSVPHGGSYTRLLPAMVIFLFIVQAITGVLLWTFYSPNAQTAWESLYHLQFNLPGGWLIRGIHHFAAQLMPVLLGCYLLGLIFTGRYRTPREFVFWTAFLLFLLSLGLSLTGDLLSWTLSGFSATLVRVRFLQMLPFIGEPLFRIVCGGPEFGTLTISRFLVLHILVMAGGFFALLVLWRFFDYRAATLEITTDIYKLKSERIKKIPLFSNEILQYSLASLAVMMVVLLLVYRTPMLNSIAPDTFTINENLPREATLGVHLGAPADPSDFYDAARPEWSFRALYHFSNLNVKKEDVPEELYAFLCKWFTPKVVKGENSDAAILPVEGKGTLPESLDFFPGEKKYIPIFVVTGCVAGYIFIMPVIGRLFIGHCFNILVVATLFVSFCYLTYASYHHDYFDVSMQKFRDDEAAAARLAERAIELCLSTGIPPTGALTLMKNDPFIQGPVLYKQHCAMCHPFAPFEGEAEHADFKSIPCETPRAPNLYNPIRKEWIAGFLDPQKIRSAEYFANTKFASGAMVGFVRGDLKEAMKSAEEDFGIENSLDQLVDFLLSEAKRDFPRGADEPVSEVQNELFSLLTCGQCHGTYEPDNKPVIQAPDLRGYMSRDWLIGIIADPESKRFYGPPVGTDRGNDAMPVFHRNTKDAVMTMTEIEVLTDWLRGKWSRFQKITKAEEAMLPVE